jgi:hypothetical protein
MAAERIGMMQARHNQSVAAKAWECTRDVFTGG